MIRYVIVKGLLDEETIQECQVAIEQQVQRLAERLLAADKISAEQAAVRPQAADRRARCERWSGSATATGASSVHLRRSYYNPRSALSRRSMALTRA